MFEKLEINSIRRENLLVIVRTKLNMINLYLRFLAAYPKEKAVRNKIFELMSGFFQHLKNEKEVYDALLKSDLSEEDFKDLLLKIDLLYFEVADYYHDILEDFEIALSLGDFDRVIYRKQCPERLNEENKQLILKKINECQNGGKNEV